MFGQTLHSIDRHKVHNQNPLSRHLFPQCIRAELLITDKHSVACLSLFAVAFCVFLVFCSQAALVLVTRGLRDGVGGLGRKYCFERVLWCASGECRQESSVHSRDVLAIDIAGSFCCNLQVMQVFPASVTCLFLSLSKSLQQLGCFL